MVLNNVVGGDHIMQDSITALTKQLAIVVLNNTATQVADNVEKARAQIDKEKTTAALEQIINELVRDKAELTRIAQAYEQELASQKITKKELEYITENILPLLDKFIPEDQKETVEQLSSLLSVETLAVMQLLGFNYKRAIGEPLTVLSQRTNLLALEIIKDPEASKRYEVWTGKKLSVDEK